MSVKNKKLIKIKFKQMKVAFQNTIKGYTVIDSVKAILQLTEDDLRKVYGTTTERALVFTKVKSGRSPLIAIRVTQPKPSMIVLHGLKPSSVDDLAVRIAKIEKIPLIVSQLKTEEELINNLRKLT